MDRLRRPPKSKYAKFHVSVERMSQQVSLTLAPRCSQLREKPSACILGVFVCLLGTGLAFPHAEVHGAFPAFVFSGLTGLELALPPRWSFPNEPSLYRAAGNVRVVFRKIFGNLG